jgi:hypothetical protein
MLPDADGKQTIRVRGQNFVEDSLGVRLLVTF